MRKWVDKIPTITLTRKTLYGLTILAISAMVVGITLANANILKPLADQLFPIRRTITFDLPLDDKLWHFGSSGGAAFLLTMCLRNRMVTILGREIYLGAVIAFVVIATEEFSQQFIPARGFDWIDLSCDIAGIYIMALFLYPMVQDKIKFEDSNDFLIKIDSPYMESLTPPYPITRKLAVAIALGAAGIVLTFIVLTDLGFLLWCDAHIPNFYEIRQGIKYPYSDKVGHFFSMGILALLFNLMLQGRSFLVRTKQIYWGTAIITVAAVIEEFTQAYIPHRGFDLLDLWVGLLGIYLIGSLPYPYASKLITIVEPQTRSKA